jgi:hypothetical protein
MAGKDPKKPGLGLSTSPVRREALLRLYGTLSTVKVNTSLRPSR